MRCRNAWKELDVTPRLVRSPAVVRVALVTASFFGVLGSPRDVPILEKVGDGRGIVTVAFGFAPIFFFGRKAFEDGT